MSSTPDWVPIAAAFDGATTRIVLDCLSGIRDQFSFARLAQAGVSAGWRCLVVNAGNGSVARWLSGATAPRGTVIATTETPDCVPKYERITVVSPAHDLMRLANGPFDLIHARLPIGSHDTPSVIVTALVERLRPGGALIVETCDDRADTLLYSTEPAALRMYERYQAALGEVVAAEGSDEPLAGGLPDVFVRAGLVGVDVVVHGRSWAGGTAGARLHVVLLVALHERLVSAGMAADELHRLRQILSDPQALVLGRPIFSIIGRRPRSPGSFETTVRSP